MNIPTKTKIDNFTSEALRNKIDYVNISHSAENKTVNAEWTFDDTQKLWFNKFKKFSEYALHSRQDPRQAIRSLVLNKRKSITFLESTLSTNSETASLIPCLYHTEQVTTRENKLGWFPRWLIENFDNVKSVSPRWLYGCALWHIATAASSTKSLEPEVQILLAMLHE